MLNSQILHAARHDSVRLASPAAGQRRSSLEPRDQPAKPIWHGDRLVTRNQALGMCILNFRNYHSFLSESQFPTHVNYLTTDRTPEEIE
jgi:hypothetical protein